MKSEQLNELAAALVSAQSEFPTIAKDATNPFFKSKYADLATVVKTASPILAKHGLAVSQHVDSTVAGDDDQLKSILLTYLIHTSGQYISHAMPLLLPQPWIDKDGKPHNPTPQDQGSAITYARRYSYMSVLGLVADEDDDGNAASKRSYPSEKKVIQAVEQAAPSTRGTDAELQQKLNKLRLTFTRKGMKGTDVTDYCLFLINKESPTTVEEADTLLAALEDAE